MNDDIETIRQGLLQWTNEDDVAIAALDRLEARLKLLEFAEPKEYANAKRLEAEVERLQDERDAENRRADENYEVVERLRAALSNMSTIASAKETRLRTLQAEVERLRAEAKDHAEDLARTDKLILEVERLRGQVAFNRTAATTGSQGPELTRLRAEVERLREALRVLYGEECSAGSMTDGCVAARDALAEEKVP